MPEIQGTTQEVALAKVKKAAEILNGPCITEDTALCFKAMGGLPGAYIKDFLKELGHEGKQSAVASCSLPKLTRSRSGLNTMLSGFPTQDAFALCTFGYCAGPGQEPRLFEGRSEGKIVPSRGSEHFGWVG